MGKDIVKKIEESLREVALVEETSVVDKEYNEEYGDVWNVLVDNRIKVLKESPNIQKTLTQELIKSLKNRKEDMEKRSKIDSVSAMYNARIDFWSTYINTLESVIPSV